MFSGGVPTSEFLCNVLMLAGEVSRSVGRTVSGRCGSQFSSGINGGLARYSARIESSRDTLLMSDGKKGC